MWPWGHVAFAYVLYSLATNAAGRSPRGDAVVVLAVASLFPDLLDKPLSWLLAVFPQGYAVGHSLLAAPAFIAAAITLARRAERPRLGVAFAVGHLSHLAGDLIYPFAHGEGVPFEILLWPVVRLPPYVDRREGLGRLFLYVRRYAAEIASGQGGPYLEFQLALVVGVVALWLYDGAPVLRESLRALATMMRG